MTTRNPVRIARWHPKTGGAQVTVFPTEPRDTQFIQTLVTALKEARAGNVRSFAMVFRAEMPNGDMQWVKCFGVNPDDDDGMTRTMLIGAMKLLQDQLTVENGAMWKPWEK